MIAPIQTKPEITNSPDSVSADPGVDCEDGAVMWGEGDIIVNRTGDTFEGISASEFQRELEKEKKASRVKCAVQEHKNNNTQELIATMSNNELAAWQYKYPEGTPQYILGQNEWNRRLTVEQVKASRYATRVGILSTILGALLGATLTLLGQYFSP